MKIDFSKTKNSRISQAGFTLIELLVAVSIFAIFIVAGSKALVDTINLEQKANVLRKTQSDTRNIMEGIMREAKSANGEFTNDPKVGGVRVAQAYELDPLPPARPERLIIYRTDAQLNKILRREYYLGDDNGILYVSTFEKNLGASGGYAGVSTVPLNDPNQVRIVDIDFGGSTVVSDLSLPPLLRLTLDAESGEGIDADRANMRAGIRLTSSATPRSY